MSYKVRTIALSGRGKVAIQAQNYIYLEVTIIELLILTSEGCHPWKKTCTYSLMNPKKNYDITLTPIYSVETWGLSLQMAWRIHKWRHLKRLLISMISCMIKQKSSVPHDVIWAEMGVAPTKAPFQSVACIQWVWAKAKVLKVGSLHDQNRWKNREIIIVVMLTCKNHFILMTNINSLPFWCSSDCHA